MSDTRSLPVPEGLEGDRLDAAIARLVMLVGYGMYYNASIAGEEGAEIPLQPGGGVDDVIGLVDELIRIRKPAVSG